MFHILFSCVSSWYFCDFRNNKHYHCKFIDEKMEAKAWANYLGVPAVTQWSQNQVTLKSGSPSAHPALYSTVVIKISCRSQTEPIRNKEPRQLMTISYFISGFRQFRLLSSWQINWLLEITQNTSCNLSELPLFHNLDSFVSPQTRKQRRWIKPLTGSSLLGWERSPGLFPDQLTLCLISKLLPIPFLQIFTSWSSFLLKGQPDPCKGRAFCFTSDINHTYSESLL